MSVHIMEQGSGKKDYLSVYLYFLCGNHTGVLVCLQERVSAEITGLIVPSEWDIHGCVDPYSGRRLR